MKEPIPDPDGRVRWKGFSIDHATLVEFGYRWDAEKAIYVLSDPKLVTLVPLAPISFEVDEFHRAVHAPYGGDCK